MKRKIIYLAAAVFWIAVFSFLYIKTEKRDKIEYTEGEPLVFDSSETVFISDNSKIYHKEDCFYVNENYYETEKERAEYMGKRACKKCFKEK